MPANFLVYKVENLRKVNAQRRGLSQPELTTVPVLTKGQVGYVPEGAMEGEPATCYNCQFYNYDRSCQFLGERIPVKKLIWPLKATADAKPIQYWPCCSSWMRGEPNTGPQVCREPYVSADQLGLGWINAPRVGQEYGGACCSGKNGGDDCDSYISIGEDKRAESTAFCRVLQQEVEGGAVCTAWMDDDWMSFDRAQNILKDSNA